MSLLLGVRGPSSQKTEQKPIREGPIQQPGSLYSANSSTPIWGNSLASHLWCGKVCPPSSTAIDETAKSSFLSKSEGSEINEELRLRSEETPSLIPSIVQNHSHPSECRAEKEGEVENAHQISFSTVSTSSVDEHRKEFQFGANTGSKSSVFTDLDIYPDIIFASRSEEETRYRDSPVSLQDYSLYIGLDFKDPVANLSTIASEIKRPMVKNDRPVSVSDVVDKKIQHPAQTVDHATSPNAACPQSVSDRKETTGIFIFGASGSSTSSMKPNSSQQKTFQTFPVMSSKMRGKPKRHGNIVKGTAVSFGSVGSGLPFSTHRSIISPLESSDNSDAVISEGNSPDRNDEAVVLDPTVSVDVGGAQKEMWQLEDLSDAFDVDSFDQNQENVKEHVIVSQDEEVKHDSQVENMAGHFSSWLPFHRKSSEEPKQRSDPLGGNAWNFLTKGIFFSKARDSLERVQMEPQSSLSKDNMKGFLNQNDETGKTCDPSSGPSFPTEISCADQAQDASNIGKYDIASGTDEEHFRNTGGKELPANRVLGSFQKHQVQTGILPSIKTISVQESIEGLDAAGTQNISYDFSSPYNESNVSHNYLSAISSSTPLCTVKNFGTSGQNEPADQKLNCDAFENGESSFPNLNFSCSLQETQLPTGEFSGPVSSSESSESEIRPTKSIHDSVGDEVLNMRQHFEFQGNLKNTDFGMTMGGKNTSSSLNSRFQRRGLNRHKKNFHKHAATQLSLKQNTSKSYVSLTADNAMPIHGIMGLQQPSVSLDNSNERWPEFEMEDKDDYMHVMENETVQVSKAVTTNQTVPKDSNEWMDYNFSSKRSESWKRETFEEGQKKDLLLHPAVNFQIDSDQHLASQEVRPVIDLTFDASHHVPAFASDYDGQPVVPRTMYEPLPTGLFDKMDLSKSSKMSISSPNQYFSDKISTEKSLPATSRVMDPGLSAGVRESSNAVISAAAEQTCEQWRLRGNQAYANGDFPKAEEYYSRGASSISPSETSQSCIRASMLCYSNRAATRMAVGRMREALADCKRAMVVDSGFLRVRLRAASCHLALGESKDAAAMFNECVKHAKEGSKSDPKILGQAMEGLKKCQQLDDYSERAMQLLLKGSVTDSAAALRLVNEAMSISPYSEPLHELKAQVLISLGRYEEAIQLCEQSLPAAERNHGVSVNEHHQDSNTSGVTVNSDNLRLKIWRWRLSAKGLYHLGKLDEALDLLTKHDAAVSENPDEKALNSLSSTTLFACIRDLLRHKAAGNEAFQLGKHAEAVEHYTAALACNGESRPFSAICLCNRAAASQALGCIADAIADCSRAIALDPSYPKALSRRATLHEIIRDYGQACNDLRRLIVLLEGNQSNGKHNQKEKGSMATTNGQDLKQANDRLVKGEEEMKKGLPVDHYMLLGVDSSCSSSEIKKAYRKAALKHHPDKSGQFLTRENGDVGGLWKELGDNVRADAERLFKLIGEAYGVLSDPDKKSKYDFDEEQRKLSSKDNSCEVPSSVSEGYRTQFEKSGRRQRERWDVWSSYSQFQRWQSGPDAAQPDTYARRSTYGGNAYKTGNSRAQFSWDDL